MAKLAIVASRRSGGTHSRTHASAHGAQATISGEEPGTLEFEVLPRDDATRKLLYELYRDAVTFEEHRDAASIARFREEACGMFRKSRGFALTVRVREAHAGIVGISTVREAAEWCMKDLAEMSPDQQIEWYLARDGQRYGPLSDAEMTSFKELGHMHMTDLVWREGFANWMPAAAVFNFARRSAR